MKLKISILLTMLFLIPTAAFGQKKAAKPIKTKSVTKVITPAKTPTAKEILAKYTLALGGRAANEKIKSRMMKGTMEIQPMGIKGDFESYAAAPDKSVTRSTLAGIGDLIEGFDGQNGWSINPLQGNRDKKGEELAQTKLISNFYREINLAEIYREMKLKGTEKVGANDAYVLVVTAQDSAPEMFYFDTKTGLLLRQDSTIISPEGKMPTKIFFEDVREVDGIKLPFKIRTVIPQFEIIINITEVKHNVIIEDGKFAKPKV